MRLDKFLKVSRIIKRRTISKEMSESSRVKVNGKIVKELRDHVLKDDSSMLYEILDEKKKEDVLIK